MAAVKVHPMCAWTVAGLLYIRVQRSGTTSFIIAWCHTECVVQCVFWGIDLSTSWGGVIAMKGTYIQVIGGIVWHEREHCFYKESSLLCSVFLTNRYIRPTKKAVGDSQWHKVAIVYMQLATYVPSTWSTDLTLYEWIDNAFHVLLHA